MEKINLFFSDVLRKQREPLNDEAIGILRDLFFPGAYAEDPNRRIIESEKDMLGAYAAWEAEQAKKPKPEEKVKPMTDEEIESLARLF